MLHDGGLWMELHTDGTCLVGAFDAFHHVDTRNGGDSGDAQRRILDAQQRLMVPRRATGECRGAEISGN